jgi:hypothetical protein
MTFSTGHPDLDFLDVPFDLTVALTNEAGPRDAYAGICFSYIDEANFAAIYVERDGFVSLASYVDGTYYAVIPWSRPTPILIPPYVVRLVDSGRRVLAYINGSLLFDIPSEILGPGGVYFFVGTYDETPSTWGFDNIQLRQAPA